MDNPDFLVALYMETREKIMMSGRRYAPHPEYYGQGPYLGFRGYDPYFRYRGYGHYRRYRGYGPPPGYGIYGPYAGYRRYRAYPGYKGYGPYAGFGRYGAHPYYREYGGFILNRYEEGTLILDFVDPELNEVIWQGSAKSLVDESMDTQKRERHINNAVQKILGNFSPADKANAAQG